MSQYLLLLCLVAIVFSPCCSNAAEQVTLKSGTTLVGVVSIDGANVHVKLGESQVTVPMADVQQIGPVGQESTSNDSAQRLLIVALESRLQGKSAEGPVRLLAEAYRLSPEDPRICYWYVISLIDAGLGKDAKNVFEAKRVAIEHAYPGMADKLVEEIEDRINLPAGLIAKLNQLKDSIGAPSQPNLVRRYARFRAIDQNSNPIDKAAIDVIISDGTHNVITGFPNGYYLFVYDRYRGTSDRVNKLVVNWPDLEPKEFELRTATDHVADAGTFVVRRLDETAKVPYKFYIVDPTASPILGAQATIKPDSRSNARFEYQSSRIDSEGRTQIMAFPLGYNYSVSAEGFKSEIGHVLLTAKSQDHEEQVVLYPTITGTIRFSWSMLEKETPTKTREIILPIGQALNTRQLDAVSASWISAVQDKDTVTLQRGPAFYGERSIPGETLWVRRIPDELIKHTPLEAYSQFDLKNIDSVKGEIPETKIHRDKSGAQRDSFSFPVQQGEVYVGKLPALHRQTGRPAVVSFKVFVEEASSKP